jgi:hypothetical protein
MPGGSAWAATNSKVQAITNDVGLGSILNLPIGRRTRSFSKDGFQTYQRSEITLLISQVATIDVVLRVGTQTEAVTVTQDASLLQTQTSSVSSNLSNDAVTELPLLFRSGVG